MDKASARMVSQNDTHECHVVFLFGLVTLNENLKPGDKLL